MNTINTILISIVVISLVYCLLEAWQEEIKKINNCGIRLTRNFDIKEALRCLKQPFTKFPIDHKFCWGRILFWYIDFDLETSKKYGF